MMCEIRRRKPEPTLLLSQEIFNLPHHIGMRGTKNLTNNIVSGRCLGRKEVGSFGPGRCLGP